MMAVLHTKHRHKFNNINTNNNNNSRPVTNRLIFRRQYLKKYLKMLVSLKAETHCLKVD